MDSRYMCNIKFSGRGEKSDKLQCVECGPTAHLKCLNIRKEDLEFLKQGSAAMKCENCLRRKGDAEKLVSPIATEGSSSGIMEMLQLIKHDITAIKSSQRTLEVDLGKSIDSCHEKLDASLKNQEMYSKKLEETLKILEVVRSENLALQKENKELKERLEDLEQYSRMNMLEIHGMPSQPLENTSEVIKTIGKALDVRIEDCDIDVCHRLNLNPSSQLPSPIVVKFCRRSTKEEILRRRRVKRNLFTLDLGFTISNPVYIESLCPAQRRLFAKCRQIRSTNIKYLWTRNGKIFLRKEDSSPVVSISMEEDLKKFSEPN